MRILLASSAIGLGHIVRDRVLIKALSSHGYDVEILCSEPALSYARYWGLKIHGVSYSIDSISKVYSGQYLSRDYRGFSLKLIRMINRVVNNNAAKIVEEVGIDEYDAVIADESWEFMKIFTGRHAPRYSKIRKILVTDFAEFRATSISEIPSTVLLNAFLRKSYRAFDLKLNVGLKRIAPKHGFIDIGLLPPILRDEMLERDAARKAIRLNNEYLILFSLGGTAAGADLIDKIIRAIEVFGKKLGNRDLVSLIIAPGSEDNRLFIEKILGEKAPKIDVEILENMYRLPRIVRAFDIMIAPAGLGAISLMISSAVPGIVFPSRRHFEQRENARTAPKIWEGIISIEDPYNMDEEQIASLLIKMIKTKPGQPPDIYSNVERAVGLIKSAALGLDRGKRRDTS